MEMLATAAKERPILFRGSMVRAILSGRKTQTRRVMKTQPVFGAFQCDAPDDDYWFTHGPLYGREPDALDGQDEIRCPYGKPGDRLWVRETWMQLKSGRPVYRADFNDADGFGTDIVDIPTGEMTPIKWKPSIFMPREACRIVLEITDVRVERLNKISEKDALAEGAKVFPNNHCTDSACYVFEGTGYDKAGLCHNSPSIAFACLYDEIYGDGAWSANPWVWAITFKPLEAA